jgi:fructose-bisphosphate aldolase class 1
MIARFSRALVEDLTYQMSDAEFDKSLAHSIDEISKASTIKAMIGKRIRWTALPYRFGRTLGFKD